MPISEAMKFDLSKLEVDGMERYVSPSGKTALLIRWSCDGLGFGELTVTKHPNGQIALDTESMSMEFVDKVMSKLHELVGTAEQEVNRFYLR